jgi:2-oxoisovalerate dehydrogenase E2 component (dihydrolipoyl transacylase)
MRRFNLPDLGEGLQEAEIVSWHVAVGDTVAVDQPMVAMETAKAVVEVPAPWAGVITALHGRPGDTIATGAPLVDFQGEEAAETPVSTSAADAAAEGEAMARGGVVGHMPETGEVMASQTLSGGRAISGHRRSRVVPAARELARRLGIDVESVQGTGAAGLVTLDDVLAAQPATIAPAPRLARSTSALRPASTNGDIASTGELEILRSLRRAMAQSMTLARDNVMECTVFDDADIQGWRQGADYTVRLLRAITAGCRAEPGLNAWFDGSAQGRRVFQPIHVGIAVDTPDGLLVPVIRDAAARDAAGLRAEVNRLKAGARDRSPT